MKQQRVSLTLTKKILEEDDDDMAMTINYGNILRADNLLRIGEDQENSPPTAGNNDGRFALTPVIPKDIEEGPTEGITINTRNAIREAYEMWEELKEL